MEAAYSEAERPFLRSSSNPPAILQQSSSAGCQTPRRQPIGRLGMRDRVAIVSALVAVLVPGRQKAGCL
jgi:hypothetical protein